MEIFMTSRIDALIDSGLNYLKQQFGEKRVEKAVKAARDFNVEIPAWQFWAGFGGGGRFEKGGTGGAARNTREIAEDAGHIHKLTQSTPEIAMHSLWFFSTDGVTADYNLAENVKSLNSYPQFKQLLADN